MQELLLPEGLMRLTKGCEWNRVTIGLSESRTYRLTGASGNYFIKIHSVDAVESLRDEKERLEWLQGRLPVPEALFYEKDASNEYLLLSEVAGLDASDKSYETMLPQLMRQLAIGLRAVHEVRIDDCPFDRRLDTVIAEAGRRVEHGLVDEEDFDSARNGANAEALFQELLERRPAAEDLVFTHGDYCLPNIILQNGEISGFIDWGRGGIADRYQDLALAVRSIIYNFGEEYVAAFLDAYGISEPDHAKISYYQLLDEFF
ncbi:MAG: APH(3') family aminoglycoside O-phosphotransferase [Bacillota bacterium]